LDTHTYRLAALHSGLLSDSKRRARFSRRGVTYGGGADPYAEALAAPPIAPPTPRGAGGDGSADAPSQGGAGEVADDKVVRVRLNIAGNLDLVGRKV